MKEYNVICLYFNSRSGNLEVNGVIVQATNSEEAKKQALITLEKAGKQGASVVNVIENKTNNTNIIERMLWQSEHYYDTYEKKVLCGKEIVNELMKYLVFDESELLSFLQAIRAICNHLSRIDGNISFKEYTFFYDIVISGSNQNIKGKTKKDYDEFLSNVKKRNANVMEEISFGKIIIEGWLQAKHINVEAKVQLLRLAALFFTVDGEVNAQEKQYFSDLFKMLIRH